MSLGEPLAIAERGEPVPDARVCVHARFELRADQAEDAATAAGELIARLQEMTSRPQCACDLDVSIEWPRQRG